MRREPRPPLGHDSDTRSPRGAGHLNSQPNSPEPVTRGCPSGAVAVIPRIV
jgi:hypothetical protein